MVARLSNKEKIIIRKINPKDLRNAKKFQDFINSLIKEEAQIIFDKKKSIEEEKAWLKNTIKNIRHGASVFLVAEVAGRIVGTTGIDLRQDRQRHVGEFGITIAKDYRGIGLGTYLTKEIIRLAKKELKPPPKIIRLSVFSTNKPAIELYKKVGFKKVAIIPKQIKYKGKYRDETIMLLYL